MSTEHIAIAVPVATAFAVGSKSSPEENRMATAMQFEKTTRQAGRNREMKNTNQFKPQKEDATFAMTTHDTRAPGVKGTRQMLMGLVMAMALVAPHWTMATAAQLPVDLLSTAHFAILSGAAITTTGGGIVNGDVGASPIAGSSIGIPAVLVNGIIYKVDASGEAAANVIVDAALLTTAKNNLTTAYNDAAGRTAVDIVINPGSAYSSGFNIGGLTLPPGLYKFAAGQTAFIEGSDLTLAGDSDGVWIFQCAVDLQVGSSRKVILSGGAKARNIFWQVGTSATLGTGSDFKGTIMADQAITMMSTSTMEGRALARIAGITFDGTSGSLPKSAQVITNFIPTNGSAFAGSALVGLSAQASSLLPVSFTVASGPGIIALNTNLVFTATGLVNVVASQAGNVFYDPAANVTNTYTVLPAAMLNQTITNFLPVTGSDFYGTNKVGLSAQATSLLPVSFVIGSGPGIITGNTNLVFTATGMVSIVARQLGNMFYNRAPNVTNIYNVLPAEMQAQTITNFMPVDGSAFVGTDKVGLSAEATSLLPVSFAVGSGPGIITGGTNLVFTATGLVSVVASQAGNMFYYAAPDVVNTYTVIPSGIMLDQTIINFMPTSGTVFARSEVAGLSTEATSLLPVSFAVISGPGIITGGTNLAFTANGLVSIVASQGGSMFYNPAPNVTNTIVVVSPARLVFHDFDGDGVSDLVVYDSVSGKWFIHSLQNDSTLVWDDPFGGLGLYSTSGDYNGDGADDMVVYDPANGLWYARTISGALLMWAQPFGFPRSCAVPGDYDGDGLYDLAVYDMDNSLWYISLAAGGFPAWGLNWGNATTIPVPGDYDGDGSDDIAMYDTQTGDWHIRTMDGRVLAWFDKFGWSGGDPVAGDYDGDGIWDLAIFERAVGNWYIRTLSGRILAWGTPWGCPEMTPVPGDYDGDGAYDLAVYDGPSGNWYVISLARYFMVWGQNWGYSEAMPPRNITSNR